MAGSLQNRVAIVTGAGSGLGEATSEALARAGVAVAAVDLVGEQAERVAGRLRELGGDVLPLAADVSSPEQVARAVETALERFGRIDFAISNAGTDYVLPITEMTIEQFDRVMRVNLFGAFLLAKAVFPIWQRQGGGHFVSIASTAAKRAWANASAYHASKWGLIGLTRAIGVEGRPYGIKSTAMVPGGMRTHFFDRLDPPPDVSILQDPRNVAEIILFVLSQPPEAVIQEVIVTPLTETSWP